MQTFHLFLLTHTVINHIISRSEINTVQKFEPAFELEDSNLSMGVGGLTIYMQPICTLYKPKLTVICYS